jgi:Tfp pilus assembly protein PilP
MTRIRTLLVALCAAALVAGGAGCGDEPQAKKPSRPKAGGGGGGAKTKRTTSKRGKGAQLQTYPKVEDKYRHVFSDRDFKPDVSGDENRDPFRSYVVRLAGTRRQQAEAPKIEVTELCTKENSIATAYALKDLRLIGIVLRGTRSWAVFTDRKQYGHFVRKGDCLGKEKARIEAIGAGFVRLEWLPEAAPGAAAPAPRKEDRQLHPEEFMLEPEEAGEAPPEAAPGALPSPAPAPAVPR